MGDSQVLAERASIEATVVGRTLCGLLEETAERLPDAPAYSDPEGDGWSTLTYSQARRRALEVAAGFVALGLEPDDAVAIMMVNRSEHVLADLGAVHAGGRSCSIYATFAPGQISFVVSDVGARIAVIGGPVELARWEPVLGELPGLRKIIMLDGAPAGDDRFMSWADFVALGERALAEDPAAIEARWRAMTPAQVLSVLYTSGTTGNPKGVPITNASVMYQLEAVNRLTTAPKEGAQLSYLTYAHVAERVLSLYLPLSMGYHVHFCTDMTRLGQLLGQVRPVLFFGVPRVWEKMAAGLRTLLATQPQERQEAIRGAMDAGEAYIEACQYGRTPPDEVRAAFEAADAAVLSTIRTLIGLDRAVWIATGGAPMPEDARRFFAGLGVNLLDVYGMTETTGGFFSNTVDAYKIGTVGQAGRGVEARIAEDGEVLVRSPLNCGGYLNRPEASAELIDEDGWLHTGDVGVLDDDGFLRIVDRKKELIITAGGENISPANIENALKEHPLIGQALAFGDMRPHPVALLTLDPEAAAVWAGSRGIAYSSLAELTEHPDMLAEVEAGVDAANAKLARVQQVKRWRLLPVEWTTDTEELTPSLKMKRRVIHAKYADVIDSLYTA